MFSRIVGVAAATIFSAIITQSTLAAEQSPAVSAGSISRESLMIALELASDFSSGVQPLREDLFELLYQQANLVDDEWRFTYAAFQPSTAADDTEIAASSGTQSFDYMRAVHQSYARYKGAQARGERATMARQLSATQKYASLAGKALELEAQSDELDATRLTNVAAANRRPPLAQEQFFDRLKLDGPPPEIQKLWKEASQTAEDISNFEKKLRESQPDKIGASAVELLREFAAVRRQLAQALDEFFKAAPADLVGPSFSPYDLVNPHDREETIDLFIRPVSLPPQWKLAIVNAPNEPDKNEQKKNPLEKENRAPVVQEAKAGAHYRVTLPAKGQIRVASVVIPSGPIGSNTAARWAVEGRIGNELIGGMMHELYIPAVLPDLELPEVGTVTQVIPAAAKTAAESSTVQPLVLAGAALVGAGILGFYVFLRRRRPRRG